LLAGEVAGVAVEVRDTAKDEVSVWLSPAAA
jgi:hypothetical protein